MSKAWAMGLSLIYFNLAVLPVASAAAPSQPPPPAETPTPLDPVVVTATKLAQPASELPTAITVIERQDIEAQQATDVLQLLRGVPGLSVTQTGSRGGLTSVFPRGGNANFNLVLVDGVPVNNAGGAFDFSDLTTDNVERIEILRGPQSAIYGANAIGSVIQLFTRRGRGPLQADVSLTGGSFDTVEAHASLGGGTSRLGGSFGVGYISTAGILPLNNDYRNLSLSAGLDAQPVEGLELAFSARYTDSHFAFPTEAAGDRFGPLDPEQFQERQRLIASLRGTHAITPRWEQTLLLGWHRVDTRFEDPFNPPVDAAASRTDSAEQRLFLNYGWNVAVPEFLQVDTTLSLGLEAQGEALDQRSRFGASVAGVDRWRSQRGYYAQALFNWRRRATLLAGLRVEDSSVFGVDANPRLAASYTLPWLGSKLRGGFATGIRAPSFVENFGTGSPFVVGNPRLKPERSRSWEIGFDQPWWDGQALLSATYFVNRFRDLISFVGGATPSFFNIQEAESRGVEVALQAMLPWRLRFTGSYTFLATKVLDDGGVGGTLFPPGQPLLRRPKHRGGAALTYAGERATVSLIANVVGPAVDRDFSRRGSPRVALAGHTKLDLAASYVVARQRWGFRSVQLQGNIDNLLDDDYEEAFGFSAPGIGIRGGIALSF
jgi:vitamin B12 transporter